MYTSYSLTKSILASVHEGDQSELCRIIEEADSEVLADEIFQIVSSLLYAIPEEKRKAVEERIVNESTRYDFETLTQNLRERFTFQTDTSFEG